MRSYSLEFRIPDNYNDKQAQSLISEMLARSADQVDRMSSVKACHTMSLIPSNHVAVTVSHGIVSDSYIDKPHIFNGHAIHGSVNDGPDDFELEHEADLLM